MLQEKLNVLLVEPDPGFACYLADLLAQACELSAGVVPVKSLSEALALLVAEPFGLVLMDLNVPDGAGLANVGMLRSYAPEVPIVLVGESTDELLALEAAQAGAHDYLVKRALTPGWLERSIHYALERHRCERALQAAEEKYHSVFDHLVEGVFRTTPAGRYLMANSALARIYGYNSPEELIGSLTDISRRLYVQERRRDEFVRLMQERDTLTGFESQVYRKDGTLIWISENCRAVRDGAGALLYYEGTVEDITQRRLAEEKLRHSQALYHSLVETLPQNIFRKDRQSRFTFANQQFCQTLGRPLEEVVGKSDFDFFPPALARKYQGDDRRVLETGELFEDIEEYQRPDGSKRYIQVVKTPVCENGSGVTGLQGIFWDITQQHEAEGKIRRANIELAQSREELRAKNRQMEEDLKMAREIQLTMLPQQYPSFPCQGPGSESAFAFTHRYLPTGSVGGDFFTISALAESQVGVFVCDVAGHGVRSALVTAMIRALVEELKPLAANPGDFLTKLNQDLCAILRHTGTPLLTTAFYLVADWRSGVMRYANAGHPKPLHVRRKAGQVVSLANAWGRSQPALGLMEDLTYQSSEVLLSPRDLVFLFTDGLVEVQSPQNEIYHPALLAAEVQQRLQLPASKLFDEVLAHLHHFAGGAAFTDDVCLVGVELAGGVEV